MLRVTRAHGNVVARDAIRPPHLRQATPAGGGSLPAKALAQCGATTEDSGMATQPATPQEEQTAALARAAGLGMAWAGHRADVEEAVATAARLRTGFARPADPAVEPTPAHRAPAPRP
jgi:hypothetical protein